MQSRARRRISITVGHRAHRHALMHFQVCMLKDCPFNKTQTKGLQGDDEMLFTNLFQSHNSDANRDRKSKDRRRHTQRNAARRSSFSPRFEPLENRAMLTTFTVTNLDDIGEGSLRDAIDDANMEVGADVIEFAPSVQGTIGLTSELGVSDDLTINGPGQGALTISGGGSTRVFNTGADVAINNLTISDGHAVVGFPGGGGILNIGGELSLDQVVMRDNVAPNGGAVFSLFGDVHVSHSSFDDNLATTTGGGTISGGAIASVFGNADVSYSNFTDNQVDSGSAIGLGGAISATFFGTLDVSHSQFEGNSVSSDVDARGGAIAAGFQANPGGGLTVNVTVDHSLFVNNSAEGESAKGGAIWADVSSFELDHSSIVDNKVVGTNAEGGGIYNAGDFTLTQSNVNANQAIGDGGAGVGGGIYNVGTFAINKTSNVHGNKASTSDNNVFGALTLLDEAFADPTLL